MTVRPFATLAGALTLAACAHQEPRVVTRDVHVPITVSCVPDIPPASTYASESVPLSSSVFELVQALLVDREQRKAREVELRTALDGCR